MRINLCRIKTNISSESRKSSSGRVRWLTWRSYGRIGCEPAASWCRNTSGGGSPRTGTRRSARRSCWYKPGREACSHEGKMIGICSFSTCIMAYLHCWTRIRVVTKIRFPNLMATLYYAEHVQIVWSQIHLYPQSLLYPFWDGYLYPDWDQSPCSAV